MYRLGNPILICWKPESYPINRASWIRALVKTDLILKLVCWANKTLIVNLLRTQRSKTWIMMMTSSTTWTTSKWAMILCLTTPLTLVFLKDLSQGSFPKLKRKFLVGIFPNEREDCCKTERALSSAESRNKTSLSASKESLIDWVVKIDLSKKR